MLVYQRVYLPLPILFMAIWISENGDSSASLRVLMDTLPVFEQIHVADYLRSPTKKTTHLPGEKSPPCNHKLAWTEIQGRT